MQNGVWHAGVSETGRRAWQKALEGPGRRNPFGISSVRDAEKAGGVAAKHIHEFQIVQSRFLRLA